MAAINDKKMLTPETSILATGQATMESSGGISDVESQEATIIEKNEQSSPAPSLSGRQLRGIKWILVVASILTSTFLFGLDNTITADVQPAIVSRFDSVSRLPWLSVAFMVAAASTTLFWYVSITLKLFSFINFSPQGRNVWSMQREVALHHVYYHFRDWLCGLRCCLFDECSHRWPRYLRLGWDWNVHRGIVCALTIISYPSVG